MNCAVYVMVALSIADWRCKWLGNS